MRTIVFQCLAIVMLHSQLGASNTVHTLLFDTVEQIHAFANNYEEYPAPDSDNWYDPDFSSFHKKIVPHLISRTIASIGLKKSFWNAQKFQRLMQQLVDLREANGYMGRFVQKFTPEEDDQIILFGNLSGAFHSLVRCLNELIARRYLDDSLMISDPHAYIFFNGNVVNGSPYILETLTLIMVLMQKNPGHVFYLRGQLEDKERWKEGGLLRELRVKAHYANRKASPLPKLVQKFFNTLPLAFYLVDYARNKTSNVVRISSWGMDFAELNEDSFSYFFDETKSRFSTFKLTHKQESKEQVAIQALIKNEPLSFAFRPTDGLQIRSKEKGITTWTILSSPTGAHRRLYDFFFDAFSIISIKNSMNAWTIRLCNRDTRDIGEFACGPIFNIVSGQEEKGLHDLPVAGQSEAQLKKELQAAQDEIARLKKMPIVSQPSQLSVPVTQASVTVITTATQPSVDSVPEKSSKPKGALVHPLKRGVPQEIKIGTTIDLTRNIKQLGIPIRDGILLGFNECNSKGGIRGATLILDPQDDGYEKERALKNVQSFIDRNIDILIAPLGSPTLESYQNLIQQQKVLVLFPMAATSQYSKEVLNNIIRLGVPYFKEAQILFNYVHEQYKPKKYLLFYQDDAFGFEALAGAKEFFKKAGIEKWVEIPYARNASDFARQVEIVNKEKADAIGFFGTAAAATNLIRQIGATNFYEKVIFGMHPLFETQFISFLQKEQIKFVISNGSLPNYESQDIEIVKDFNIQADKYRIEPSMMALYGYMSAVIFIDLVQRLKTPLTKEALLNLIENTKNYRSKGLMLNFNPETRELLDTVWIDNNNTWVEIKDAKGR